MFAQELGKTIVVPGGHVITLTPDQLRAVNAVAWATYHRHSHRIPKDVAPKIMGIRIGHLKLRNIVARWTADAFGADPFTNGVVLTDAGTADAERLGFQP